MESSAAAATSFWIFMVYSILIQNIITFVDCSNRSVDITCPQKCSCLCDSHSHSLTVDCSNANYGSVPLDLPTGTSKLILDGNHLDGLRNDSLSRLASVHSLSLRNCGITTFEESGFSYLSNNLSELLMSRNQLKKKSCTFLKHLRKLALLDLSGTRITTYPRVLKSLSHLKRVILVHNSIKAFPTSATIPTLETLILSDNLIEELPPYKEKAAKYSQLQNLILKANEIRDLDNNNLLLFPKLKSLDLSLNQLRDVPPLAFKSTSLQIINLYNSKLRLDQENWNIFQQTPNIKKINIGFCKIECGNLTRSAFHNLRHLTHLDLSGTRLSSFSHMFVNLPNLATLRLSNNPISSLRREDFDGIADSLRELNVSSGRLSTINYESLPLKVWKNLRSVDFSENRFLCDCNFIWLRRWLKGANASKVKVKGWDKYYCQTSKGQIRMLQLENPSDTDCFQDPLFEDPHLLTVLLLTSFIWITSSTASALHRFRWHIRYWYFIKTVKTKRIAERYRERELHDFFTFDVFIGYSSSDSYFVLNELLPRLENDWNLRVCIHERDWLPGRDLTEHVLESIDNSRKTLLIVSNAFALSPWCHFELTMAQTRLMEEDRDSLVLILLEEIADCNLTPRLQIQMQRRTYFEWTKQSNVGQQLFWANLKHALAKPSDSFMNESLSKELLTL